MAISPCIKISFTLLNNTHLFQVLILKMLGSLYQPKTHSLIENHSRSLIPLFVDELIFLKKHLNVGLGDVLYSK